MPQYILIEKKEICTWPKIKNLDLTVPSKDEGNSKESICPTFFTQYSELRPHFLSLFRKGGSFIGYGIPIIVRPALKWRRVCLCWKYRNPIKQFWWRKEMPYHSAWLVSSRNRVWVHSESGEVSKIHFPRFRPQDTQQMILL